VQLQGNLKEFSLPNIFQLVKMSAQSGALTIRREGCTGKVFFRRGQIYYAYSVPQDLPLGERLVQSGAVTAEQLEEALASQKKKGDHVRIGSILLKQHAIDRATLERAVREQIQDAAFDFFRWADGEFEFRADERVTDEDILVQMDVETVIIEGCRRLDEWELIFAQIGSLEGVPHLTYGEGLEDHGEITLTPEEWRVLVRVDGRADINVILRDCGLDRFHGAKVIYSLFSRGLVTVSEPAIEQIGRGLSVAVKGPIDLYNEVFLATLTESQVVQQLRVELIEDAEIEIPVLAGYFALADRPPSAGDTDEAPGEALVFTVASSVPESAWRRLAGESSAWVVLANANDRHSLRAARADVEFVRSLEGAHLVVATYVSVAEEELSRDQVAKVLGLGDDVAVLPCDLRQRESVSAVVRAALELATA
jgi:hypothetical protein